MLNHLYRSHAAYDADRFGWDLHRAHGFRWQEVEGAALRAHDPALGAGIGFAARLADHGRITDPGAYVRALAAHVGANRGSSSAPRLRIWRVKAAG